MFGSEFDKFPGKAISSWENEIFEETKLRRDSTFPEV
jgi:hypothetical protein